MRSRVNSGLALSALGAAALVASSLLAGCGSSSPPGSSGSVSTSASGGSTAAQPGSASQTESCAASPVTWKDNGTEHCAQTGEASLNSSNEEDTLDGGRVTYTTLEIVAVELSTNYELSLAVTNTESIDGTYDCTATPNMNGELTYNEPGVFSTTVVSCTITVSVSSSADGGMTASGTFSAVLNVTGGGTKMLTDGMFNLAATQE